MIFGFYTLVHFLSHLFVCLIDCLSVSLYHFWSNSIAYSNTLVLLAIYEVEIASTLRLGATFREIRKLPL